MWADRFAWRSVPRSRTDSTRPYNRWLRFKRALLVRYIRKIVTLSWPSIAEQTWWLTWRRRTIPRPLVFGDIIAHGLFDLCWEAVVTCSGQWRVVFSVTAWPRKCLAPWWWLERLVPR